MIHVRVPNALEKRAFIEKAQGSSEPFTFIPYLTEAGSYQLWAFVDGEAVGGLSYTIKESEWTTRLCFLFVLPEFRKHGVGAELVRWLVHLAKRDHQSIRVVLHSDPNAIGFYEKLGFRLVTPDNHDMYLPIFYEQS
jgi:GNAT superfamily N-acetyltransferase